MAEFNPLYTVFNLLCSLKLCGGLNVVMNRLLQRIVTFLAEAVGGVKLPES